MIKNDIFNKRNWPQIRINRSNFKSCNADIFFLMYHFLLYFKYMLIYKWSKIIA